MGTISWMRGAGVGHFSRCRGGDAWADALLAQPPTVFVVVVALVCANLSRFAAARTLSGLHRQDRVDHRWLSTLNG